MFMPYAKIALFVKAKEEPGLAARKPQGVFYASAKALCMSARVPCVSAKALFTYK
jgi:hypothetical protein